MKTLSSLLYICLLAGVALCQTHQIRMVQPSDFPNYSEYLNYGKQEWEKAARDARVRGNVTSEQYALKNSQAWAAAAEKARNSESLSLHPVSTTQASTSAIIPVPTASPYPASVPNLLRKGSIQPGSVLAGHYLYYCPAKPPRGLLTIVHGTPDSPNAAAENARKYLARWISFAEDQRLLVVAPIFENSEYGSFDGSQGVPAGGYRGLYGKHFGADTFLDKVASRLGSQISGFDGRVILYGHSAGGQFVSRYLVRHPERVKTAVISASGRYPYPDQSAPWPYGMGATAVNINGKTIKDLPDPKTWLAATHIKTTVVVGANDTDPQPARPGHKGTTRLEFARHWVEDMNQLATQHNFQPLWNLILVPNTGHSSKQLTPTCQRVIAESLNR